MTIDLTPLYRNSVGFDRLVSFLEGRMGSDAGSPNYPPYNIEATGEDKYAIALAVAGFSREELDISLENSVLTVRGKKAQDDKQRQFLHKGIAAEQFERTFSLAEHVEVAGAELSNGLLTISLVKQIPEEMKPRQIPIQDQQPAIEHDSGEGQIEGQAEEQHEEQQSAA